MINQEEFAFGLDPITGSSVNPITQQLDKATGIFKYRRTKNSGLTYKVFYSSNLSGWTLDAAATQPPESTHKNPIYFASWSPPPGIGLRPLHHGSRHGANHPARFHRGPKEGRIPRPAAQPKTNPSRRLAVSC
jgi:hypothetical protein